MECLCHSALQNIRSCFSSFWRLILPKQRFLEVQNFTYKLSTKPEQSHCNKIKTVAFRAQMLFKNLYLLYLFARTEMRPRSNNSFMCLSPSAPTYLTPLFWQINYSSLAYSTHFRPKNRCGEKEGEKIREMAFPQ